MAAEPTFSEQPLALIVEDDPSIAYLLQFMLEKEGFATAHAADGQQCARWLDGDQVPDLVIMDIMLPYRDGLSLLEDMRADPAWQLCPVLMLSAKNGEVSMTRAIELGASDYISKPFDPMELTERVRRLYEAHRHNHMAARAAAGRPRGPATGRRS